MADKIVLNIFDVVMQAKLKLALPREKERLPFLIIVTLI